MWGHRASARLVGASALALLFLVPAGCGGRSARRVPGEPAASGGDAGTGAAAGTFSLGFGGTGIGGAGGSAGSEDLLRPCGTVAIPVGALPAIVVLLDGGDAMLENDDSGVNRWEVVRAMTLALLETLRDGAVLGVSMATESSDPGRGCVDRTRSVLAAPLDVAHRRSIEGFLESVAPGGQTVLLPAYVGALDGLEASESAPVSANVVVLAAGLPGLDLECAPVDAVSLGVELTLAAETAASHGIHTFAVGLAGTADERWVLSSLAVAGGTAAPACNPEVPSTCYHDFSDPGGLSRALGESFLQIALRSPSVCSFRLDGIPSERPLNPDRISLLLTRDGVQEYLSREEPDTLCESGWQLSADETSVVLCPGTCESFRNDAFATLELALGCDGPPPRN